MVSMSPAANTKLYKTLTKAALIVQTFFSKVSFSVQKRQIHL